MINLQKRLIACVALLFFVNVSANNFFLELKQHHPDKADAIQVVISVVEAGIKPDALEEMKLFSSRLITSMSNYSPNSAQWEELLKFYDLIAKEFKRNPVEFCEMIEDRDFCYRILKSRINFLLSDKLITFEDQVKFLKDNPINQ